MYESYVASAPHHHRKNHKANDLIVDLLGGERHTLPNPGGQLMKLTLLFRNEAGVIVWHAQTKRHYEPPGPRTEGSIIPRSLMIIIPPDTRHTTGFTA